MTEVSEKRRLDPSRRRSLRSPRLWLAVVLAFALLLATSTTHLLWRWPPWWAVLLCFPAGHLSFGFSLLITRMSWRFATHGTLASLRYLYQPFGLETMAFYFLIALSEEILFRVVPLTLFGASWWTILGTALLFAAVHALDGRHRAVILLLDMLLFGLAMGWLFAFLPSPWPLVLIHFLRNACVAKVFVAKSDVHTAVVDQKNNLVPFGAKLRNQERSPREG
ncbi:MAG: CPBP family intramembrane metalloprotease [Myxococcota bacterium]|jgi:membrane protease YdiL (CAAX protease family)|nr:CPBP family intramembrane metalloprotease [Myxococcota bacterium]